MSTLAVIRSSPLPSSMVSSIEAQAHYLVSKNFNNPMSPFAFIRESDFGAVLGRGASSGQCAECVPRHPKPSAEHDNPEETPGGHRLLQDPARSPVRTLAPLLDGQYRQSSLQVQVQPRYQRSCRLHGLPWGSELQESKWKNCDDIPVEFRWSWHYRRFFCRFRHYLCAYLIKMLQHAR